MNILESNLNQRRISKIVGTIYLIFEHSLSIMWTEF
jgi:hypothetical protein